jgi:hypothetical protein
MVPAYLTLIEFGKRWFDSATEAATAPLARNREHRVHRRAARFSLPRL